MNPSAGKGRARLGLAALILSEAALFGLLLVAGPLLGTVSFAHLSSWAGQTDPATVLTALCRLAGLVLSGWLVITTLLYGAASTRSGGSVVRRGVGLVTLGPIRRLIDGAAAVSILVSAATATASAAGATTTNAVTLTTTPARAGAGDASDPAVAAAGPGDRRASAASTVSSERVTGRHLPHPGLAAHNATASAAPSSSTSGSTDPAELGPGYTDLPAGTLYYVVQPGDCLSVIAERHLGDWRRDDEIDQLNRGRPQADGRALVDDHWIYPGWVLVMPAGATGVQTVGADGASVSTEGAATADAAVVTTTTADPPSPAPDAAAVTSSATHAAGSPRATNDAVDGRRHQTAPWAPLGVAGVAAGGFSWGIRRRRKERMHDRPSGRRIRRNGPGVEAADAAARSLGEEDMVRWIDLGLRYLGGALLERDEATTPSIAMVRAGADGMEVLVAPPTLDAPRHFEAVDGGALWVLDPSIGLDELETLARPCWPFLPALVTIGEASGGTVLVNLEHAGSLSVNGDPDRVDGLLAQMAMELRTQPWTEEMLSTLDVIGLWGDDSVAADLEEPASALARQAQRYQAELAGAPSVAIRRAATCQWLPSVLIAGRHGVSAVRPGSAGPGTSGRSDGLATALQAAVPDRAGVAVVTTGTAARWRIDIDADGQARLSGAIGSHPFEMRLAVKADADTLALLEEALELPLGPVDGRPAGAEDLELLDDEYLPGEGEEMEDYWGSADVDVLPPPTADDSGLDDAAAAPFHDSPTLARPAATPAPPRPAAAAPPAPTVELTILGPVGLTGAWNPDAVAPNRRASALAVIAFLAAHGRPVTADELAAALWPADPAKDNFGEPRRKTVMNVISRARSLLGEQSPLASPHLLLTERGYVLGPGIGSDWARFRALTDPVATNPSDPRVADIRQADEVAAARIDALREALELVDGGPFAGSLSSPFFEWVSAEHLDLAIQAAVVDAAEELARLALDAGRLDLSEWALHKGLDLDPVREELFRIWMHVTGRSGRPDQVEEIYRRLCRALQRHIDPGQSPSEDSQSVRASYSASVAHR